MSVMDGFNGTERFSVVAFSTNVSSRYELGSLSTAMNNLDGLVYKGGYTNTGEALKICHETLKDSLKQTRVIVMLTDGTATSGKHTVDVSGKEIHNVKHQQFAVGQANNAKDAEIIVIPVAVKTFSLDLERLEQIATDPNRIVQAEVFADLEKLELINELAAATKCGYNTTEASKIQSGTWMNIFYDDFENADTSTWNFDIKNPDNEVLTKPVFTATGIDCPSSGTTCIGMFGDPVDESKEYYEGRDDKASWLASKTIDLQAGVDGGHVGKVRVQFSYVTQNWIEEDKFFLEYHFEDPSSVNWDVTIYTVASHFNNDVKGYLEKWIDVPENAAQMHIRFNVYSGQREDVVDPSEFKLFIDNIDVKKLVY
jgi:hypothetical protein